MEDPMETAVPDALEGLEMSTGPTSQRTLVGSLSTLDWLKQLMPIATSLKSVYPLGVDQKTTSISRCVLLVVFLSTPSGCTHFKDEANSHIYLKSPRARRVLPRLG